MIDNLVVGGDSPIGKALVQRLQNFGETVCATSRRAVLPQGVCFLDMKSLQGLEDLPATRKVFLVAAETRFQNCESDKEATRRINVDAPGKIARIAFGRGAKVLFFSSIAVHDGLRAGVPETADPTPNSEYGRQKADAERVLRNAANGSEHDLVILRPSKVVGSDFPLFAGWRRELLAGKPITPFDDLTVSLVSLDDLLATAMHLQDIAQGGVFHLSAADQSTYADLAVHMADKLGANHALVQPIAGREILDPKSGWFPDHAAVDCANTKRVLGRDLPTNMDVIDNFLKSLPV